MKKCNFISVKKYKIMGAKSTRLNFIYNFLEEVTKYPLQMDRVFEDEIF